jgi:hypothetical protein
MEIYPLEFSFYQKSTTDKPLLQYETEPQLPINAE